MKEDRTYQQALKDLTARIAKDLQEAIQARIERLVGGATVVEATADIEDEHMRSAVKDIMLHLHLDALTSTLGSLDILNQKQIDELHAYLRDHLK